MDLRGNSGFSPTTDRWESPEQILTLSSGFMSSRILLTAFELGLFTALADQTRTSAQVAMSVETDPRATDRLLNALVAMGLLEKGEGRFSNTELAARYLVQGSPDYLAGLGHHADMWNAWATLTEAVRQGRSVPHLMADEGEEDTRFFIALMDHRAHETAPAVVALLDLSQVTHVLDLGGGSGAYALAFARASDRIRVTVFDRPEVILLTREYLSRGGLAHRIETRAGDFHLDEMGHGFDLVFISAIIHGNSPEENRLLLGRAAEALNPGGQMVVQDFIMDEDHLRPAHGAIFALNMLVGTPGGDTYTEAEVNDWLTKAGLASIKRVDTGLGADLIVSYKPEEAA